MGFPAAQTDTRRKPAHRSTNSTPRLDLSAAVVAPPFTGMLWTEIPHGPANRPPAALTPVTLTVGNGPAIQLDMTAAFAAVTQWIADHPVLCMSIAAGTIFAIWAYNQQNRSADAIWG
jgi:hypothetical protein